MKTYKEIESLIKQTITQIKQELDSFEETYRQYVSECEPDEDPMTIVELADCNGQSLWCQQEVFDAVVKTIEGIDDDDVSIEWDRNLDDCTIYDIPLRIGKGVFYLPCNEYRIE